MKPQSTNKTSLFYTIFQEEKSVLLSNKVKLLSNKVIQIKINIFWLHHDVYNLKPITKYTKSKFSTQITKLGDL